MGDNMSWLLSGIEKKNRLKKINPYIFWIKLGFMFFLGLFFIFFFWGGGEGVCFKF